LLSSLEKKKPGPKKGSKRLSDLGEHLIEETIKKFYLTKQKRRISKVYLHFREKWDRAQLPEDDMPSERTFRRRIDELPKDDERKGRMFPSEIYSKHSPKTKHFEVSRPLEIVQIDHTPIDAFIVSDVPL